MDVATISLQDAGIRKAAILVASLDPAAADALLGQLGPERAALVRQAVAYLDDIEPAERQRILDEFRRIGPMVPGRSPSGIELDKMPAGNRLTAVVGGDSYRRWGGELLENPNKSAKSATGVASYNAQEEVAPPFEFLREAEDDKLARLLADERPPTVALVLSHLPPERAGEVLACLPPDGQVEVVRRLADLENTDAETLREVERALEARWSKQFAVERRREAGPETVAKILASCNGKIRGRILDNLASHDRSLAERFGDRPIAFDDVARFNDAALLAVYRAVTPEVALAALLGAPEQLVERILRQMPPKEAKQWRGRLKHPEPIRLSDIEEARRQIAALAQRMSRENPAFAA